MLDSSTGCSMSLATKKNQCMLLRAYLLILRVNLGRSSEKGYNSLHKRYWTLNIPDTQIIFSLYLVFNSGSVKVRLFWFFHRCFQNICNSKRIFLHLQHWIYQMEMSFGNNSMKQFCYCNRTYIKFDSINKVEQWYVRHNLLF